MQVETERVSAILLLTIILGLVSELFSVFARERVMKMKKLFNRKSFYV